MAANDVRADIEIGDILAKIGFLLRSGKAMGMGNVCCPRPGIEPASNKRRTLAPIGTNGANARPGIEGRVPPQAMGRSNCITLVIF
jgi:hypothetical protein